METISQIHNIYIVHQSYMFRLPQYSHHKAVYGIIKNKLFTKADTNIDITRKKFYF